MKIKRFYYFGTGAGLPSLFRNVSAMAVDFENEWFLFDCGEGTQQKIMHSDYKMSRLSHIFISHFHGDHLYGLPGLLATMQLQGLEDKLTIVAPKGIKNFLDFVFQTSGTKIKRDVRFVELEYLKKPEIVYEHSDFKLEAASLSHRINCFGYRLRMNDLPGHFDSKKADELEIPRDAGRKKLVQGESIQLDNGKIIHPSDLVSPPTPNPDFTYITDTKPCKNISLLSEKSDYLHHECTFAEGEEDLALKSGHCTLNQVLDIARQAEVKQLHLAHFSSRHNTKLFRRKIEKESFKSILTEDDLLVETV